MGSKGQIQKKLFLKWPVVESVTVYLVIVMKCLICLHEKHKIINCTNQEELLNRRSELISKCRVFKY